MESQDRSLEDIRNRRASQFIQQNQGTFTSFMFLTKLGIVLQVTFIAFASAEFICAEDIDLTLRILLALPLGWLIDLYSMSIARIFTIGNKMIEDGELIFYQKN